MFLTRMHLNPARRGTRNLLTSPQRMHAAVMCSFPPVATSETEDQRVLWRVDRSATSCTLYVSSPTAPDLTHVVEQAGWPTHQSPWESAPTESFLSRLDVGQQWLFRLAANPVRSQRPPEGGRGKRLGHVTATQQEEWLKSRSSRWGFDVSSLSVTSRQRITFSRRTDASRRTVTLNVATFDGVMSVTDPLALRRALCAGVGSAKGYGCGLITVAPTR